MRGITSDMICVQRQKHPRPPKCLKLGRRIFAYFYLLFFLLFISSFVLLVKNLEDIKSRGGPKIWGGGAAPFVQPPPWIGPCAALFMEHYTQWYTTHKNYINEADVVLPCWTWRKQWKREKNAINIQHKNWVGLNTVVLCVSKMYTVETLQSCMYECVWSVQIENTFLQTTIFFIFFS